MSDDRQPEVAKSGMKLYFFPVAPNPTRVRLYLAEKAEAGTDIPVEPIPVDVRSGEQNSPEHLARNPFGRLPVLELPDGTFVTESLAIIELLEELYPDPPLIGREPVERSRVRELERIAELGVLIPVARIVHATNSPFGWPPVPEIASFYAKRLPASLRFLDDLLADGRSFLSGDHPTIADFTLEAAFQFARFGEVEIDPALENLARWDESYRARPAAAAVLVR